MGYPSVWAVCDTVEYLQDRLCDKDVSNLRAASKDWKGVVDKTLKTLRPVSLACNLLTSRILPGLKELRIDQVQQLQPQQLLVCTTLTQLTALYIGGPACSQLRSHHLAWIGKLTNLRDLSVVKCTKVRLNVLSHWHALQRLSKLTLIGLAFTASDVNQLHDFLAAGAAASLSSLVLGNQRGLSFLSDKAVEGLGRLLGPAGKLKVLDLSGCIELTDRGVGHLAGLQSLETLQLPNCMKISAGAMQVASHFTRLKTLNLRGCSQLLDPHLELLLLKLTALQVLNLQACSGLAGAFFIPSLCSRLVMLKTLNLSYCQGLNPGYFGGLAALPALHQLDVTGCPAVTGPEVLLLLGQLKHVMQLLGGHWRCRNTGSSSAALLASRLIGSSGSGGSSSSSSSSSAGNLVEYAVDSGSSSRGTMQSPVRDVNQQMLLQDSSSSSNGPATAAAAATEEAPAAAAAAELQLFPTKLQQLVLSHLSCDDGLLKTLLQNLPPTLTSLDLSHCQVPGFGECLQGLQGLSKLQSLNLSNSSCSSVSEDSLGFLSALTGLTFLCVDHVHSADGSSVVSAPSTAAATDAEEPVYQQFGAVAGSNSNSSRSSSSSSYGVLKNNNQLPSGRGGSSSRGAAGVAALMQGTACFTTAGSPVSSSSNGSSSSSSSCSSGACLPARSTDAAVHGPHVRRSLFPGTAAIAAAATATHSAMRLHSTPDQQQQRWLCQLQQLQHLSISFSPWVDDTVIAQQLSGLTNLASLDLIACNGFSGSGFRSLGLVQPSGLTRLNLTGCRSLSDEGLQAIAACCGALQELQLAGCRAVTDEGVGALCVLTGLRQLGLASNKNLISSSMARLCPSLRHLRHLGLSLCPGIADDALQHLATAAGLTSADLRGCWRITDEGVHALLAASTSLLQLNLDSCHRLTSSCCPANFCMAGHDSSSSSSPGSSRWPAVVLRVSAAPFGTAAALQPGGVTSGSEAQVDQDLDAGRESSSNSDSSSRSSTSNESVLRSGSGSSLFLEMSELQQALDRP